MPYKTPVGTTYDSGDFPALFEAALDRADVAHFKQRAEARRKRRASGAGSASRAFSKSPAASPARAPSLAFPGESRLLLAIGVQASGQGHRTLYRRLAAERLGIPVEQVDFEQGDSDDGVPSAGAVASRSTMSVGGAVVAAIDAVIEKGRRVAAHLLEAAEADIVYRDGVFEIAGTDRRIGLFDLADAGPRPRRRGHDPRGSRHAPHRRRPADLPERRACRRGRDRPRYRACDAGAPTPRSMIAGACLQPVLVEGQVQGGVAQGVGQALLEHGVYDPASGQLLAGSFMDYAMPRADDLPDIASELRPAPARTNPLGVKGVGEAGTTASLAAVMNAVADALPEAPDIDMPATPERVWRAIHQSRRGDPRNDRTDPRPGLDDRRQGARKRPRTEPSAADRRRARRRRTAQGDEARGPVEPVASRDRDGQGLGHARHGLWRPRIRPPRRRRQAAGTPRLRWLGGDPRRPEPRAAARRRGGTRAGLHPRRRGLRQDDDDHAPDRVPGRDRARSRSDEILAVTFTDKAAGEMRARLAALGVDGVDARTFHSAALAQLRRARGGAPGRILSVEGAAAAPDRQRAAARRTASGRPATSRPRSSGRRTGG